MAIAIFVFLAMQDYLKLAKTEETIVDLLAIPDVTNIDFETLKLSKEMHRAEELD
ncbi:TPA: hypothetical protein ACPSKE_002517 [Legionella feeleii]